MIQAVDLAQTALKQTQLIKDNKSENVSFKAITPKQKKQLVGSLATTICAALITGGGFLIDTCLSGFKQADTIGSKGIDAAGMLVGGLVCAWGVICIIPSIYTTITGKIFSTKK